jgi:hypothetical protein
VSSISADALREEVGASFRVGVVGLPGWYWQTFMNGPEAYRLRKPALVGTEPFIPACLLGLTRE